MVCILNDAKSYCQLQLATSAGLERVNGRVTLTKYDLS